MAGSSCHPCRATRAGATLDVRASPAAVTAPCKIRRAIFAAAILAAAGFSWRRRADDEGQEGQVPQNRHCKTLLSYVGAPYAFFVGGTSSGPRMARHESAVIIIFSATNEPFARPVCGGHVMRRAVDMRDMSTRCVSNRTDEFVAFASLRFHTGTATACAIAIGGCPACGMTAPCACGTATACACG